MLQCQLHGSEEALDEGELLPYAVSLLATKHSRQLPAAAGR